MESDSKIYWIQRWRSGQTGWHQGEPEPALVQAFSDLSPGTGVLVPLCGKSLDLAWLAGRGLRVLGIELAEQAIREFLAEHQLSWTERQEGPFLRFDAPAVTLLCGDIFELTPEILRQVLGPLGAIYDRAALIALPKSTRARYAERIRSLARTCAAPETLRFLQITLERQPGDEQGPPHSVSEAEVRALYAEDFEIRTVSREELPPGTTAGPAGPRVFENVFELSLMQH